MDNLQHNGEQVPRPQERLQLVFIGMVLYRPWGHLHW